MTTTTILEAITEGRKALAARQAAAEDCRRIYIYHAECGIAAGIGLLESLRDSCLAEGRTALRDGLLAARTELLVRALCDISDGIRIAESGGDPTFLDRKLANCRFSKGTWLELLDSSDVPEHQSHDWLAMYRDDREFNDTVYCIGTQQLECLPFTEALGIAAYR